jgi:hypothetical protein
MINRQNNLDNFQPQLHILMNILCLPILGLLLVLAFGISACTPATPVAEADYNAKIVGSWLGMVGDMKESISFSADGSFVAQVRPQGFISNTLNQGVTGTIRGTWAINGKNITLKITGADDENVLNSVTSSTIMDFYQDEISLKSDQGETSTFQREISL